MIVSTPDFARAPFPRRVTIREWLDPSQTNVNIWLFPSRRPANCSFQVEEIVLKFARTVPSAKVAELTRPSRQSVEAVLQVHGGKEKK